MKKLVITSFEQFASRSLNASREIVKCLPNQIDLIDIKKEELKVSWNEIESEIDKILENDIDYLILCGEAASYQKISIEKNGTNQEKGMDSYGVSKESPLTEIIQTKFDIKVCEDLDIAFSESAGSYLCNKSYYLSLSKTKKSNIKVMFIHFPLIEEQGGMLKKEIGVQTLINIIERLERM